MKNKKTRKIVVYLMIISMLLTSLLSGIAFLLQ
ncbi:stressosome-associated protein Prli42 [Peribacillus loiseleuriae]|nr:stressosome-associated protein Prli42 [Peribacillus loiseleuriae]